MSGREFREHRRREAGEARCAWPADRAGQSARGHRRTRRLHRNDEDAVQGRARGPGRRGQDRPRHFRGAGLRLISRSASGALQVSDADGVVRNEIEKPVGGGENERRALAGALANHFQQITLLADWKPNGGSLTPNKSIEVSLVPVVVSEEVHRGQNSAPSCRTRPRVTRADWQAAANAPQRIPLCAFYQIRVRLAPDVKIPLRIGGSVLSADGQMFVQPSDGADTDGVELRPVEGENEAVLRGLVQADDSSLGKQEYVYVLGLPAVARGEGTANFEAAYAIPWHLLSTDRNRSAGGPEINERE